MALWPHQEKAVAATEDALVGGGRATVVMACGTGKTRVAAEASRRLAPSGPVLVVVPTLALLHQTVREFTTYLGPDVGRRVAVCSADPASVYSSVEAEELAELEDEGVLISTDPALLHLDLKEPGRTTVLTTYHSLPTIAALHADHQLAPWELMVVDEAHRSAGKAGRAWSILHEDTLIPARRRLYMTATPRLYRGTDSEAVSMDDPAVYGPCVYRLPFGEAIETGLLADYRVVVTTVTSGQVAARIADGDVVAVGGSSQPASMLAAQIALVQATAEFGLRRVITYHHRVASAHRFAQTLLSAADLVPAHQQPTWPLRATAVDGTVPLQERRRVLNRLAYARTHTEVVANARLFTEGVDVPELDGVVFCDARDSDTDVVQALGRALRRGSRASKTATIVIPVLLDQGQDPHTALHGSAFDAVWKVVRSLRAHDDGLAARLDRSRISVSHDRGDGIGTHALDWLDVRGSGVDHRFATALALRTVEMATSSWWSSYGTARAYRIEHGHLRPAATGEYQSLSEWLSFQRDLYRKGALSAERVVLLEELGIVWNPREQAWLDNYAQARDYRAEHGHLAPPRNHPVAKWLYQQRHERNKGVLTPERITALEELGISWDARADTWTAFLREAHAYWDEHGHLRPPPSHPLHPKVLYYRRQFTTGALAAERITLLEELGMVWSAQEATWQGNADRIRAHQAEHGRPSTATGYGKKLGRWITHQRYLYRQGELPDHRRKQMRDLGLL